MKKYVIRFGLLSGLIFVILFGFMAATYEKGKINFNTSEWLGYSTMVVAFCFILIGIKQYRDKELGGYITFGKAFKTGFMITLLICFIYAFSWTIISNIWMPSFIDDYGACMMKQATEAGKSQAEMKELLKQQEMYKSMYSNAFTTFLFTFLIEPLPVGIVMTLLASFIMKRKNKNTEPVKT